MHHSGALKQLLMTIRETYLELEGMCGKVGVERGIGLRIGLQMEMEIFAGKNTHGANVTVFFPESRRVFRSRVSCIKTLHLGMV